MKFAIALFSAAHAPSSRRALLFAQAALAGGHEIVRLFFYQDGVYSAANTVVAPQDEQDIARQWRRGVLNAEEATRYQRSAVNLEAPWALSGLGQLHDATQAADRLICFGGP